MTVFSRILSGVLVAVLLCFGKTSMADIPAITIDNNSSNVMSSNLIQKATSKNQANIIPPNAYTPFVIQNFAPIRLPARITDPQQGSKVIPGVTRLSWAADPATRALAYHIDLDTQFIKTRGSGKVSALLPVNVTSIVVSEIFNSQDVLHVVLWTKVDARTWISKKYIYQIQSNLSSIKAPRLSLEGGFYNQAIDLEIQSSQKDTIIVYTLDGSDPVFTVNGAKSENTKIYNGPIRLNQTAVVRAKAVMNDIFSSTVTETYFINQNVHGLGVFSLVTDPVNFFDPKDGIYVEGEDEENPNYFKDIQKPVDVSYFDPTERLNLYQSAGTVSITGDLASRVYPQKSLLLNMSDEVKRPIFFQKDAHAFGRLVLSNGGDDWPSTLLRAGLVTNIARQINVDYTAYQPTEVYFNGQYWGIHQLRETVDEDYFKNNFELNGNEVDVVEMTKEGIRSPLGSADDFQQLLNFLADHKLSNRDSYNFVINQIDVDEFVKFMVMEIYAGNIDFSDGKTLIWRARQANNKWRWIMQDTRGFNLFPGRVAVDHDTFSFAISQSVFLRKLLEYPFFKVQLINHFSDQFNSVLLPDHLIDQLQNLTSQIEEGMPDHLSKWQSSTIEQWENNIAALKDFFRARSNHLKSHIVNYFQLRGTARLTIHSALPQGGTVQVNSLTVDPNNWQGEYFIGLPVKIKINPRDGFVFKRLVINGLESENNPTEFYIQTDTTVEIIFEEGVSGNQPPEIHPINDQVVSVNQTLDVAVEVFDHDSDPITISVTSSDRKFKNFSVNGNIVRFSPDKDDEGLYAITVSASDGRNQAVSESFRLTVDASENRAPVIAAIVDRQMRPGQNLSLVLMASDPENDPLTYRVTSQPESFRNFRVTGNRLLLSPRISDVGNYVLTVHVSDSHGNTAIREFQLVVNNIFIRGDANADGKVNISDAIFISNYLNNRGPRPSIMDAADANDDGRVDIFDVRKLLHYLFVGVNEGSLPAPFPAPGIDPTADRLN